MKAINTGYSEIWMSIPCPAIFQTQPEEWCQVMSTLRLPFMRRKLKTALYTRHTLLSAFLGFFGYF